MHIACHASYHPTAILVDGIWRGIYGRTRSLLSSMRTRALRGAREQRGYRSYVSGILRLTLLAPDVIEAILAAGRADQALLLESLERPLPACWEEQRTRILEPWMS